MSLDFQVVPYPTYLHVILTGDVTRQEAKDAIGGTIDAARENKLPHILVDWRQVAGMHTITVIDRFEIISYLADRVAQARGRGLSDIRIAHVTAEIRSSAEGFSETVGANRGLDMIITSNLAGALAWLGGPEQD
jgi:hypothetical protein